eukprot:4196222-Pleurochrysis_carterae.AAC.2
MRSAYARVHGAAGPLSAAAEGRGAGYASARVDGRNLGAPLLAVHRRARLRARVDDQRRCRARREHRVACAARAPDARDKARASACLASTFAHARARGF